MDPGGWRNKLGTTYVLPRWQYRPTSADDLVNLVSKAEREGRRIRMTGSGHSFSDVAINADWLLSPSGLTQVLPLDVSSLRVDAKPETLVRVQSGCTIRNLNLALEDRGLALQNMGGADVQTFVGAASTGTHGSGLAFGPLASQIEAIQLVGAGGEMLQLEPRDGISEANKFSGRLIEQPHIKVSLRHDDKLFNAVAVSLGSMGVIYAVILRAAHKFWLVERRTLTTWEELAKADGVVDRLMTSRPIRRAVPDQNPLPAGDCVPGPGVEPDHIEIYYTPYPEADGSHLALLTERWRVDCKPPGVGEPRGSPLFTLGEDLSVLADQLGLLVPTAGKNIDDVRHFHQLALGQLKQKYFANVSYKVFSIGILNEIHAYGIELAFDLKDIKAAVAGNFHLAAELASDHIFHTTPVSLRFVDASSATLAMQAGRRTLMMEIGVLVGLAGAEELLRRYEEVFVSSLGARPHWGLDRNHLRGEGAVARLYPGWNDWKSALNDLNPHGTFDGSITDRLGISHG